MTKFGIQNSSPEFKVAVGKIIERRRKQKRFTQQDLAARVGIRPTSIYQYEAGTFTPSMSVLLKIMYHLQISAAELMVCLKYDGPAYKTDRRLERIFRTKVEI